MDELPGRCISCGFLAYTPYVSNPMTRYQEVQQRERESPGKLYQPPRPAPPRRPNRYGIVEPDVSDMFHRSYLVCFLSKFDLPAEMDVLMKAHRPTVPWSEQTEAASKAVLNADRGCAAYFKYETGLTPKDHLMERRVLGLEEDRRKFQTTLESSGKRLTIAALILGSFLAFGQIVAALVAMTPDSYAAKWFQRVWSPPAQMAPKK